MSSRPDAGLPEATAIPWPPIVMTFATRLKNTAVVDRLDPPEPAACFVASSKSLTAG